MVKAWGLVQVFLVFRFAVPGLVEFFGSSLAPDVHMGSTFHSVGWLGETYSVMILLLVHFWGWEQGLASVVVETSAF